MKPRKNEVQSIAALLEAGGSDSEDLAGRVIEKVDEVRAERVTYTAVMRFPGPVFVGMGPYSTKGQAKKAIEQHPAASEVRGYAVVPTVNELGHEQMLKNLDQQPESKGDFAEVQRDAQAKRNGWKGRARERGAYL